MEEEDISDIKDICDLCGKKYCDFETRCGHIFHGNCLDNYKKENVCPYCFKPITRIQTYETLLSKKKRRISGYLTIDLLKSELKKYFKSNLISSYCERKCAELIINRLLEMGWDINEYYHWGVSFSTLFYALIKSEKTISMAFDLIEKGYNVDIDINHSIDYAIGNKDDCLIVKLFDSCTEKNKIIINNLAINYACSLPSPNLLDSLLKKGANIANYPNRYDLNTSDWSLSTACNKGNIGIIKRIFELEPNMLKDSEQRSWHALISAIKCYSPHRDSFQSVDDVKIDMLNFLMDKFGADINSRSSSGSTVLMALCLTSDLVWVKRVVQLGAKLDAVDCFGDTALLHACKAGQIEIVDYLIKRGADLLVKNKGKMTALHFACLSQNYKLVEGLLRTQKFDIKKFEPASVGLLEALFKSRIIYNLDMNLIELLLENGANVNEINTLNGRSALFEATRMSSRIDIFENLLFKYGADPNIVDSEGMNALGFYLFTYGFSIEIIEILIKAGTNLDLVDKEGRRYVNYLKKCSEPPIKLFHEAGLKFDIIDSNGNYFFDLVSNKITKQTLEELNINYSKNVTTLAPCEHCKRGRYSFQGRCGHLLHLGCIVDSKCPVCENHITSYHNVERVFRLNDAAELENLDFFEIITALWSSIYDPTFSFEFIFETIIEKEGYSDPDIYYSCLDAAIKVGNIEAVKALCSRVPTINEYPNTMDHTNDPEMILCLLDRGFQTKPERHPVLKACYTNNLDLLNKLIERNKWWAEEIGWNKAEIFLFACSTGNVRIVKRIYETGVFINYVDKNKETALHRACKKVCPDPWQRIWSIKNYGNNEDGCLEVVKFLMENGASLALSCHYKSEFGPLGLACESGFAKIVFYLMEFCKGVLKEPIDPNEHYLILAAVRSNDYELFEKIIEMEGIDLNMPLIEQKPGGKCLDYISHIPLVTACSVKNFKMVSKLFEMGAEVGSDMDFKEYLQSLNGWRDPKTRKDLEIFDLIVNNSRDLINFRDKSGKTMLHLAILSRDIELVRHMIKLKGFRPPYYSENYTFKLIGSCFEKESDAIELVDLLIEAGTNLDHVYPDNFENVSESYKKYLKNLIISNETKRQKIN